MTEVLQKLMVYADGSQQYIPLSAEEIAQREIDAVAAAEQKAIQEAELEAIEAAKVAARAKLTAGEPLTEEEALLLIP